MHDHLRTTRLHAAALEALVLTPEQAQALREHAAECYPEECCGFFIGRERDQRAVIASVIPAKNRHTGDRRSRYEIDPMEFLRIDYRLPEELQVLGFYHSHPDHPPQPSPHDLEQAWPGFVYLIIRVDGGAPGDMQAFRLDPTENAIHSVHLSIQER